MRLSVRLSGAIIGVLLCRASGARAEAALVIDEPETTRQSTKYHLQLLDGGVASLHVKWSDADDNTVHKVDFSLSTFSATGQTTAAVGFDGGKEGARSLLRYRQGVEVSAHGTELRLVGSALVPDVEYSGQLSATVDQHKTLLWDITLVQLGPVALFQCPTGPQPVNPDGSTAIEFRRTAPSREKTVGLRLSAFTSSKEQELGQVGFLAGGSSRELRHELASYPLDGTGFVPPLVTFGLTEGSVYTGRIWIVAGDQEKTECPLELSVPKLPKGELATDSQSLLRTVTLPFLRVLGDHDPSLAVRLFDKTRVHRVEGIVATLDGANESPEGSFDLKRHVSFFMNGTPVQDITQVQLPVADEKQSRARALQSAEQLNVDMAFKDLQAGKYAFGLRFTGVNTVGPSPKLDVTINVRHHWLWAVVAVLIALCLSFFISKGIVNWRERVRVRDRVRQMGRQRFNDYADLPSVAFLRTVLAQTERLITIDLPLPKWAPKWLRFPLGLLKRLSSCLLPPPPSVDDYLARAERVQSILDRYSSVRETLEKAQLAGSVYDFYRDAIADQMHRMGPQPLDKQTTDAVLEELNAIAGRLADPYPSYRSALRKQAKALVDKAGAVVKGGLGDAELVGALLETLKIPPPISPDPPGDPGSDQERKFEDAYWMVRLLYSRRAFPTETDTLIKTYSEHPNLAEVFKVADRQAWTRLRAARDGPDPKAVRIDVSHPENQESLSPIIFVLAFDDRVLAESYFVLNVLSYEWRFTLTASEAAQRRRPEAPTGHPVAGAAKPASASPPCRSWSVTSSGPRITQYAPFAGRLEVEVFIRWSPAGEAVAKISVKRNLEIRENTELSDMKRLDNGEILLMTIVAGVAVATSLPALYFAKPTFGSFGDYTAILAWAIGIDQGKNLIQLLKTFPADGGAPKPSG
jgi:hypothetical protein